MVALLTPGEQRERDGTLKALYFDEFHPNYCCLFQGLYIPQLPTSIYFFLENSFLRLCELFLLVMKKVIKYNKS